jgi:2-dehydropantoate 2-reductase
MKVCVYGAGAVGGHIAARLAVIGAEVTVVARGPHGAAIRRDGLTLRFGDDAVTVRPTCVEDPSALPPQDVVVVTVKGPALASIAPKLAPLLAPGARVVFAMNGIPWWFGEGFTVALPAPLRERLDPGGHLALALGSAEVVGCAIYSGNAIERPGVVRNTTPQRNRMILGRPDGAPDARIDAFAALAARAGLQAEVTTDIRRALWIKMQLIVAASPISALTGCTLGDLVADPKLRRLAITAMRETRTLGAALGFEIAADEEARIDHYRGVAIKPSMLQDVEAARPLEVDNGILAFCDLARALAHPVPTLDTIGALIGARAQWAAAS